jgi:hypothetical protein
VEGNERLREKVDLGRGFVGGWEEERGCKVEWNQRFQTPV